MSAPVMSKAGRYGASWAAVPTGAWVMTTGWLGSARPQRAVGAHEPGHGHARRPVRVRGLVDALPGAECRMVLELPDDVRQQSAVGRERARRQVGHVAELQPAVEAVRGSRVEHLALRRDLLVDRLEAPVGPADADEAGAAGCDLGERVSPVRRLRAQRRPVREHERKDLAALHHQGPGRTIDGNDTHRYSSHRFALAPKPEER